jgi:hypothetical protein
LGYFTAILEDLKGQNRTSGASQVSDRFPNNNVLNKGVNEDIKGFPFVQNCSCSSDRKRAIK